MPEKKTIYEGDMPKLLGFISARYNLDTNSLLAAVATEFPHILEKEKCANCKASMAAYEVPFDVLNALLLKAMADHVKHRVRKGLDFTVANQVHVTQLPVSDNIKRRTSQLGKLGLIAKLKNDSKHHITGVWVVTTNGWAALRGEPVRKWATVFRGQIVDRSERQEVPETVTIDQAFALHRDKVEKAMAKQRPPKNDYRALMEDYRAQDWFNPAGIQQGELI